MRLHVIIIGGGIGGLCLAQGLRKAGLSVTLYEKGPRRADPHWLQGYQIHINPSGSRALQGCLPPAVWGTLTANACVPHTDLQVLTEQMKEIAFVESAIMDGTSHVLIGRATCGRYCWKVWTMWPTSARRFIHYERTPNRRVTAVFADGTTASGDVLVGADETGSNVRKPYLPHAQIVDTGIVGAACRLPPRSVRSSGSRPQRRSPAHRPRSDRINHSPRQWGGVRSRFHNSLLCDSDYCTNCSQRWGRFKNKVRRL